MSMYQFNRAIYDLWSSIAVDGQTFPAYLQGTVPEDATFPFVTFDVAKARALSTMPLSATVWIKKTNGSGQNAFRAAFLDAAARAIPQRGVRLDFDGGFCILRRSSGDFLTLITDPEDSSVIGGRIGYEATFYDL